MMNYKVQKTSKKRRVARGFGIALVFICLGLMIVAADQVGQHLQEHRTGFNPNDR